MELTNRLFNHCLLHEVRIRCGQTTSSLQILIESVRKGRQEELLSITVGPGGEGMSAHSAIGLWRWERRCPSDVITNPITTRTDISYKHQAVAGSCVVTLAWNEALIYLCLRCEFADMSRQKLEQDIKSLPISAQIVGGWPEYSDNVQYDYEKLDAILQ